MNITKSVPKLDDLIIYTQGPGHPRVTLQTSRVFGFPVSSFVAWLEPVHGSMILLHHPLVWGVHMVGALVGGGYREIPSLQVSGHGGLGNPSLTGALISWLLWQVKWWNSWSFCYIFDIVIVACLVVLLKHLLRSFNDSVNRVQLGSRHSSVPCQ